MKRGIAVLACVCTLTGGVYFAISKWGIRHETLDLFDAARQRPVTVDLAVRRDYEMKANGGYWKLPVAIISNRNTVRNTEYAFVLSSKMKILSFRSKDANFKTDPGVLPTPQQAKAEGIDIVNTQFQHTWMSDRGPDSVKETIQATLDHFLSDGSASDLAPANTDNLIVTNAGAPLP